MAWFAAAMPYVTAGVGVAQTLAQGNVQDQIAQIQAKQQREQALADQAEAILVAGQERKKAKFLESRARSLAASSGTSVESPDIQNIISDIDEQGEYNALAALYSGNTSARSKNYAATLTEAQGKSAKRGSRMSAGSTVLGSYDQLAQRKGWYG